MHAYDAIMERGTNKGGESERDAKLKGESIVGKARGEDHGLDKS